MPVLEICVFDLVLLMLGLGEDVGGEADVRDKVEHDVVVMADMWEKKMYSEKKKKEDKLQMGGGRR